MYQQQQRKNNKQECPLHVLIIAIVLSRVKRQNKAVKEVVEKICYIYKYQFKKWFFIIHAITEEFYYRKSHQPTEWTQNSNKKPIMIALLNLRKVRTKYSSLAGANTHIICRQYALSTVVFQNSCYPWRCCGCNLEKLYGWPVITHTKARKLPRFSNNIFYQAQLPWYCNVGMVNCVEHFEKPLSVREEGSG